MVVYCYDDLKRISTLLVYFINTYTCIQYLFQTYMIEDSLGVQVFQRYWYYPSTCTHGKFWLLFFVYQSTHVLHKCPTQHDQVYMKAGSGSTLYWKCHNHVTTYQDKGMSIITRVNCHSHVTTYQDKRMSIIIRVNCLSHVTTYQNKGMSIITRVNCHSQVTNYSPIHIAQEFDLFLFSRKYFRRIILKLYRILN